MSTEKETPRHTPVRLAKRNVMIDDGIENELPDIESIDVTALQIDESYDGACDPYNRTGQFLVGALKKKYED